MTPLALLVLTVALRFKHQW